MLEFACSVLIAAAAAVSAAVSEIWKLEADALDVDC